MRVRLVCDALRCLCKILKILPQRFAFGFVIPVDLACADAMSKSRMTVFIRVTVPIRSNPLGDNIHPVLADQSGDFNVSAIFSRVVDEDVEMQATRAGAFFEFPHVSIDALQ